MFNSDSSDEQEELGNKSRRTVRGNGRGVHNGLGDVG